MAEESKSSGYIFTCPKCSFVGDEHAFDLSLAGEIFCPECSWYGEVLIDGDEAEEDE